MAIIPSQPSRIFGSNNSSENNKMRVRQNLLCSPLNLRTTNLSRNPTPTGKTQNPEPAERSRIESFFIQVTTNSNFTRLLQIFSTWNRKADHEDSKLKDWLQYSRRNDLNASRGKVGMEVNLLWRHSTMSDFLTQKWRILKVPELKTCKNLSPY